MAKGDDIQERLIDFAVRILKLCDELPDTPAGRHIRGQLIRSETSPALNYGEVRGAESKKDFIHKLGVVLKELNESGIGLQIILRSRMLPENRLTEIIQECKELSRIINKSIQTASSPKN